MLKQTGRTTAACATARAYATRARVIACNLSHLWAEEVLDVAKFPQQTVNDKTVRHPARLGALPAVGRAPAPSLGGEALPAVAHAQRPVAKGLELSG